MNDFVAAMRAAFGAGRLRAGAPLAPLTTFRVGGPAEWLIETRNSDESFAIAMPSWPSASTDRNPG